MTGQKISDMSVIATLPSGAYLPIVDPTGSGGLDSSANYRFDLGSLLYAYAVPEQFGAIGDGSTDDTAAFTACAAYLTTRFNGGRILCSKRYKLASTLTLSNGIILEGSSSGHGSIYPSSDGNQGGTIIVDSAATILVRNGSGLRNLFIERSGLAYGITSAQVAATFLGTAITLATNTGDQILENLYIMGFAAAIKSQDTTTVGSASQNNRVRATNISIDCIAGIWLHNSYDVSYFDKIHCWPFVTVGSAVEANNAQLKRSGVAIRLSGTNDWTKVTDSFTYGYAVGAQVTDARSVTFVSVSHDHPPGSADGSKGYFFEGGCAELRVIGGQVAGKDYGTHINGTNSVGRGTAAFTNVAIWVTTTQAMRIQGGSVQVSGGFIRNAPDATPNGIGIGNENTGSAEITISGMEFAGLATAIQNQASTSVLRYYECTFRACSVEITNAYMPALASAASIVPNGVDFVFNLTGTTNVGAISSPQRYCGRTTLSFICVGGLSFLTGGNIVTRSGANTAVAAGNVFTVVSDGTNWHEV